jgi:membrane protein involved in colicin uptake
MKDIHHPLMKTFAQFITEVYDKDVMDRSQIRKTGEGGRVGADRRKSEPERRRMKAVGGGKMAPAGAYKDRKDIGTQRQVSTRQQQPEKERGSAEVKQSYADKVKAERRAAAKARLAAKASGGDTGKATTAAKKASKDAEKEATKLLATKKKTEKKASTPRRKWEHEGGGGMTRAERDKARNKEKGASLKAKKAELIKDFTEKNGRPPKGVERTKLIGLAHKAVKANL